MAKGFHSDHIILKCTSYFSFLFIIILVIFIGSIESNVYTVGDEEGWTSGGTDYQRWSLKYDFSVGDVLAFDYVKGQHNALEVTEDTFRSCDTGKSGAVIERYESGHDRVVLTQARKYWFVCDISGHCLGGMRFSVDVTNNTEANAPNSEPTPMPPADESLIPPPIQTNGVLLHLHQRGQAWTNYVIVAFGISLITIPNWLW